MRAGGLIFLALPLIEARARHIQRRQYGDEMPSCKEYSLTYPQWFIWYPSYTAWNVSDGGTIGDFGFGGSNTANGVDFDCYAQNIELEPAEGEGWHDCKVEGYSFRFSIAESVIEVKGSWECDDAPGLNFSGNGQVHLGSADLCDDYDDSGKGTQTQCLMPNTEIFPAMVSPVDITPYESELPWITYRFPPDCIGRSDYPTWEIQDFKYEHEGEEQTLSFDVLNHSNEKKASCSVKLNETLTRSTWHAENWVDCGPSGTDEKGMVSGTKVLFDKDYGILGIKQDWVCGTSLIPPPQDFAGLGYLITEPKCSDNSPYLGEMAGDSTKYSCTLPKVNISGYTEPYTPKIIPHTLYQRSCTLNSITTGSFTLKSYAIDKEENSAFAQVYNPGSGDEYGIHLASLEEDGEWHSCESTQGLPWQLASCEYSIDTESGAIGLKLQWYCDDRDPYHPILFEATAEGTLGADDATNVQLELSDLKWDRTDSPMERGPPLPWV